MKVTVIDVNSKDSQRNWLKTYCGFNKKDITVGKIDALEFFNRIIFTSELNDLQYLSQFEMMKNFCHVKAKSCPAGDNTTVGC